MESILVYLENVGQLKALKAFLKATNIQFTPHEDILPPHIIDSINRGLKQAENGQTISLKEFTDKHFTKK